MFEANERMRLEAIADEGGGEDCKEDKEGDKYGDGE